MALARADVQRIQGNRLEATLKVVRPLVPHEPSARQREFLALDCEEALYGGAAGGGKTDAILMAALQYVDVPNYSAVIFRRHETDFAMPGSVADLARQWLVGTAARWDAELNGYRWPNNATLHFGYGQTLRQLVDKYQGPAFQFIAFDGRNSFTSTCFLVCDASNTAWFRFACELRAILVVAGIRG